MKRTHRITSHPQAIPGVLRRLVWLGPLVLAITFGFKIWRVTTLALEARQSAIEVSALVTQSPSLATLQAARAPLSRLRAASVALHDETAGFAPLLSYLAWVPVYGGDLASAGTILQAVEATAVAADELTGVITSFIEQPLDLHTMPAQARSLVVARPRLQAAYQHSARAARLWAAIPVDQLSPALRARVAPVQQFAPLLHATGALALAASEVAEALEPSIQAYAGDAPTTELLALLADARPKLMSANQRLQWAVAIRSAIPRDDLPLGLRTRIDQADAIPALLGTLVNLGLAGGEAGAVFEPMLTATGGALDSATLAVTEPELARAQWALASARGAWASVPAAGMPANLPLQADQLTDTINEAYDALDFVRVLPFIMGAQGPRSYLLIAQNPDELRATGGLISAAGILTLDQGRVTEFSLRNSSLVDDLANHPYPFAPEPLGPTMGIQLWMFRDSNWSPDFPTTARAASDLYALGQNRMVDGVIAFDPEALRRILQVTGPINVDGEVVSADIVVEYLRERRNHAADDTEKRFLGRIGETLLHHLMAPGVPHDRLQLALALRDALRERHLQLVVTDSRVSAVLRRLGWDGAVRPGSQDFLMVVDSNVGYTKSDIYIRRQVAYAVNLDPAVGPQARLTLSYDHQLAAAGDCRQFEPLTSEQPYYETLAERCYWDYLRVLAPRGAQAISGGAPPTPPEWMLTGIGDDGSIGSAAGVAGTSEFNAFFVVPRGAQRAVTIAYALPETVDVTIGDRRSYLLTIQKQPGTDGTFYEVTVRLPPGAELLDAYPLPSMTAGSSYVFRFRLDHDQQIRLTYHLP